MGDLEIADLLGGVTREQMDAAIQAINGYGFDIRAPWDCDLDDREREQFCGILNAIKAARACGSKDNGEYATPHLRIALREANSDHPNYNVISWRIKQALSFLGDENA